MVIRPCRASSADLIRVVFGLLLGRGLFGKIAAGVFFCFVGRRKRYGWFMHTLSAVTYVTKL